MSRGYQREQQLDPLASSEARATDLEKAVEVGLPARQGASGPPGRQPGRSAERRTLHELRGRTYRLRNSEIATMVELGKFRAVAREDLAKFVYGGNQDGMRPDVENLLRQGLVEMKSIPHRETGSRQLLTLSKNGHRFLIATQSAGQGQAVYHGFGKPSDAHHDADLYRLYQKAAAKIASQGGKNLRVELDYELKKHLYRDLARLGPDRLCAAEAVARKYGLQMVRERFRCPTFASNTKRATENAPAWTWNSPPVTTAGEISLKKCAPDSPCTLMRTMWQNSGGFCFSVN